MNNFLRRHLPPRSTLDASNMSGQTSPQGLPGYRYPSGPLSDEGMQQPGPSTAPNATPLLHSFPAARSGLTKDGQPAKRRGPKPDSKPAASKRQQMNRAAQRSHRERKENYIKALEEEVLRFKDVIIQTVQEKDAVINENRRLRDLLAQHGINYDHLVAASTASPNTAGRSVSGSDPGSYATGSDGTALTPDTTISPSSQHSHGSQMLQSPPPRQMLTMPKKEIDYDQLGIDFVLEYASTQPTASGQAPPRPHWRPPYPSPPPQGG